MYKLSFDIGQALLGSSSFPKETAEVGGLVTAVARAFMLVTGITCVFLIIYAGYSYLSAAGNPQKIAQANSVFTQAVIGLVIVFISYWIVKAIGALTGVAIF